MPFNLGSLLTDALAGIAGGAAAVLVGQPLDTVKVKMQLYPGMYSSIASCVTKTVREQGFRGLYTGIAPALASTCGENAILFGAYGQCQKLVATATGHDSRDTNEMGLAHNAAAGAIASVFTTLVMCPSELVKIRMHGFQGIEVNPNEPDVTASQTIKNIWKADGFRGLYRGFWATLARESVSCSVFFASYEWFRRQYGAMASDDGGDAAATTVAAASTATAFTWLTVYPVDVAKSRLQRFAKVAERGDRPVWQQARILGLRTLYRGLWPTLVKTVPISGLLMYTVEYTKTVFRNHTPPPATDSQSGPVLANPPPTTPESPTSPGDIQSGTAVRPGPASANHPPSPSTSPASPEDIRSGTAVRIPETVSVNPSSSPSTSPAVTAETDPSRARESSPP